MDKIRSFRVVDRWTQRQHRLGSDFVVARSTPSPSFHDRGVWFNFRVLPIHEPGAAWEQSGAKHVPPPRQRRILLGHFVHVARGLLSSWGCFTGHINRDNRPWRSTAADVCLPAQRPL
jgi:hypothetical protein